MNTKRNNFRLLHARAQELVPAGVARRHGSTRTTLVASGAVAVLLLTGCGGSPSSLSAVVDGGTTRSATATPTPTPTPTPIAKTPCSSVESQKASAGATYICTADEA